MNHILHNLKLEEIKKKNKSPEKVDGESNETILFNKTSYILEPKARKEQKIRTKTRKS